MDTTQMLYTKTWLIVKEESYVQAQAVFRGSGVSITKEGKGIWEQQLEMMPSRKSMSERKLQLGLKNLNA